jgi:2-isopropylmalate synthase
MFSHGVDPKLNLEDINPIKEVYERCTKMSIHPRAPYAGELVFTAFSGSHQDAINKGVQAMKDRKSLIWEVPYLPIDPADIGRKYEPIVRINSQSGKGGVAFIMDSQFGYKLPKGMQREFADYIQFVSEQEGEVSPQEIFDIFDACYVQTKEPIHFKNIRTTDTENGDDTFTTLANVSYMNHGNMTNFSGVGNGPIDAVLSGLNHEIGIKGKVIDYQEHALGSGTNVKAVSYIHLLDVDTGKTSYGVGLSSNITRSSIRALFSAVNRLYFKDEAEAAGKKRVAQQKNVSDKPKDLFGNS